MLADHTLSIDNAPTDAYRLKMAVYGYLGVTGIPVNIERSFVYGRCPLNGSILVRSDDRRVADVSRGIRPVPQPEVGNTYDFCLRATPMHQTPFGKLPTDPAMWLEKKAEETGVQFLVARHRTGWTWCGKQTKATMPGFYIPDVVYLGRLQVQDAGKLSKALATGVGRHRAFGFGLLQLFSTEA